MAVPHIRELFDLTGKVAIVTGGSRGLGEEMAIGLGEAGAKVVVTARREQWLNEAAQHLSAAGIENLALVCDVSNEAQVKEVTEQTIAKFGQVDILINNAGLTWGAPTLDMPLEKWRQVLETNATGTFLMSREVARHMISREQGGRIINISSIAGLKGERPGMLSVIGYNASKGAIISMTRAMATEWATHNILVNAIAPAWFPSRMSKDVIARHEDHIKAYTPLGRVGNAGEIKGVAVFLASPASSYITGQIIAVDGGVMA